MVSRSAPAFLLLPLLLLAACASVQPAPDPMRVLREVPVVYHAELAPQRSLPDEQARIEPAKPFQPAPGAQLVEVRCHVFLLEPHAVQGLCPDLAGDPFGRVVSRGEFERLRADWAARGMGRELEAPSLTLYDGARGNICVSNQTAFVSAFDVEALKGSFVADPHISVANEGLVVDALSTLTPAGTALLAIELSSAELLRPFARTDVRLPGSSADVTLEIPIGFEQKLTAQAELGADEVLVLAGLRARSDGRELVTIVSSQRAAAPPAGQAGAN